MSRDIVIYIALVYKYLANNERVLSEDEAYDFAKKVNENLEDMGSEWEILCSLENMEKLDYFGIKKGNDGKYILFSSSKMDGCYCSLPLDVTTASLKDNALDVINVSRDNLCIDDGCSISERFDKSYERVNVLIKK